MEGIQKQIDEQFHKAFYDNIHQAIATDDHEYIVRCTWKLETDLQPLSK